MARDQTSMTEAAQASLALQSGRPVAGGVDNDLHGSPPLSTEAQNRRDVLRNLYPDLPEDLPSWELLAAMSMGDCVAAIKAKKEEFRDTVGEGTESEAFMKATTPVVYSSTMIDDRLTQIHPASLLRAPLSEPGVWWHLLPKKLPQIVTVLPQGAIGMDSGISDFAIKKMSDRTFPLQLRHILRSNSFVEKAAPISKRRAMESSGIGDGCDATWINEYDFKSAQFPWEVLDGMMSAISVYQQLFPLDFSMIIITGTLVKFQLFLDQDISTKYQLKICHHFINSAFLANARRARTKTPCLDRKQCDDQAIASLIHCKRPGVCPPIGGVAASNGTVEFGQNAAHLAAFNMSNLGRAQIHQQQQAQRAQQYQQNGGGYGRGAGQGGRGRGRSAAAGSAPKSSGSVQICPSFSKGEPCARGGDPTGSCKTVTGVILHHVCSICLQKGHGRKDHK